MSAPLATPAWPQRSGEDGRFDWSGAEVFCRTYGSVAVYRNVHGDVVIRQEACPLSEEDDIVILPLRLAELVAQEIVDVANATRAPDEIERETVAAEEREPRIALVPSLDQPAAAASAGASD